MLLLTVGYFVVSLVNRTELVFNVAIVSEAINYQDLDAIDQALETVFQDDLTDKQAVGLSLANDEFSIERFVAEWTAGEYDIMLLEQDYYEILKTNGTFKDFKLSPVMDDFSDMAYVEALPVFESIEQLDGMVMVRPANRAQTTYLTNFFAYQELSMTDESE